MFSIASAFWHSNDRLKALNYILGWTLAIAAVVAFVVSNRIETLESEQEDARSTEAERLRLISEERIAKANEGLAKANLAIEDRKKENLELSEQAAKAEAARLEMEQGLEETRKQTVQSLTLANEAQNAAFREQFNREAMERENSPREIGVWEVQEVIRALTSHPKTKFSVVALRDTEPARTGRMLDDLLIRAGWQRMQPIRLVEEDEDLQIANGISIQVNSVRLDQPITAPISTLESVLHFNSIEGWRRPVGLFPRGNPWGDIGDDEMRIIVGLRPEEHFKRQRFSRDAQRDRFLPAKDHVGNVIRRTGVLSKAASDLIANAKADGRLAGILKNETTGRSFAMAQQLQDAFAESGWPVIRQEMDPAGLTGIVVTLSREGSEESRQQSKEVFELLKSAGLPVELVEIDRNEMNLPIGIYVGKIEKPDPAPAQESK